MLSVELKKILFYQKGLLFLLLSLAVYVLLCVGNGYDSSYVIDQNEDVYLAYLERWQGQVTEEKVQEMEAEYTEAVRADEGKKAAFLTVYNQYYYAKEDTHNRFLMDERGWNTLLTHDGANVVLLLFLLALSVPVFCGEYQCGMAQLLRSCRNGRSRLAGIKLFWMTVLAALAAALFQLLQFAVVALSVGLPGADYPLQSLSFFADSPYFTTIGQAYLLVTLSRCFGAVWLVILVAFFSILFRQMVLTVFAGLAVSILPHLVGSSFLKYVLPLPAGLLAGTGYIWGTQTEVWYDGDWNLIDVVTFPGISPSELCLLLVFFGAVVGLLIWLCFRCYVGRQRVKAGRPVLATFLIVLLAASLTGCGQRNTNKIDYDFWADAAQGENSVYTIELDRIENAIYATSKATGEVFLLTREPFGETGTISCIYVDEDTCYYVSQGNVGDGFEIYCVDLTDFSMGLYFDSGSDNRTDFWGLLEREATVDELMLDIGSITSFVIVGNDIYYLQGGRVYRVCRFTGQTEVI